MKNQSVNDSTHPTAKDSAPSAAPKAKSTTAPVNDEQTMFFKGMAGIFHIRASYDSDDLIPEEEQAKILLVQKKLLSVIISPLLKVYRKSMGKFAKKSDVDAYEDILPVFIEGLNGLKPDKVKPTTYFKKYIKEEFDLKAAELGAMESLSDTQKKDSGNERELPTPIDVVSEEEAALMEEELSNDLDLLTGEITSDSENIKRKSDLSREQYLFYSGITAIDKICNGRNHQELTSAERDKIGEIKIKLFNYIYRYCYHVYQAMKNDKSLSRDDIYQEMYIIFDAGLENYNPVKTTPTTYYQHRFKEAVSKEITASTGNSTQAQKNIRTVTRAINSLKAQGIDDPDVRMIATETSLLTNSRGDVGKLTLSPKVVSETMVAIRMKDTTNIDDAKGASSNSPTPEQAMIDAERKRILDEALADEDPFEVEVFLAYYLGDTNSEKKTHVAVGTIANQFNIKESKVREIVNSMTTRLRHNESVQSIGTQFYRTRNKVLGYDATPLGSNTASAAVGDEFEDALNEALEHEVDLLNERLEKDKARHPSKRNKKAKEEAEMEENVETGEKATEEAVADAEKPAQKKTSTKKTKK